MKTAIAIITCLSFGIAGITPAFAWHITPENTNFTAVGTTTATVNGVNLKCKASFTGSVNGSGVGSIASGTFSGQLGCSYITLGNLPWTSTAINKNTIDISDVTFDSPIGNCGPGTISVRLTKAGYFTWSGQDLSGGCVIAGHVLTSPKLSIAAN